MANAKKPAAKTTAKTPAKPAVKAEKAVAIETTKDTTPAIETKGFELKDAPAKAPATKAPSKVAAKTAPAKKATKKAELKTSFTMQTNEGFEVTEKDLVKKIKEVWTKNYKKKIGDLKTIDMFIKQEENSVYFVVNGKEPGRVDLF